MYRSAIVGTAKIRVPLSQDYFRTWWTGFICTGCGVCAMILRHFGWISPVFGPDFYGMKLVWVGAFTDFGGARYRNPVHFLGTFHDFPLFSGFSGLV